MSSDIELFARDLAAILARSRVAEGRPLRWAIIANPTAGGFTIKKRWRQHRVDLETAANAAASLPVRVEGAQPAAICAENSDGTLASLGLIPTTRRGHAGELVRLLPDEADVSRTGSGGAPAPFYIIITAGGDGTSLEALCALYEAPQKLRGNIAIIRLPMGTGNDGAEARELSTALELLSEPTKLVFRPAIELSTANKTVGPFLAFNILSIGLDAFVTDTTNRMKGALPGDSYKLMVDLASVLYDKLYPPAPMEVRASLKGQETSFTDTLLLLAMGASGNRTYGSNKKILPDGRNVCAIRQMNFLRKLALKGGVMNGKHADFPEARLFEADRLDIHYQHPLLAQMDGEAVKLLPSEFPIRIRLSDPRIPVLVRV